METRELIKLYRNQRGLTQEALGKILGVTGTTINRYENGQRKITIDILEQISIALEIPIIRFIDCDTYPNNDEIDHSLNHKVILSECTHWIHEYISLSGTEDDIKLQGELIDILAHLKTISKLTDYDATYNLYKDIKEYILFKLQIIKKG